MKFSLKILYILLFTITASNATDQLYYKVGHFDYKHETGGLALSIKNVTDKNFNIPALGQLSQIYEFYALTDKNNFFSGEGEPARRDEYAIYASTGLQKSINLNENFSLVPSFSVGLYQEFDQGKDMGFPIQFKSEIELNYYLSKYSFIGFTWNHISNADIGETNPGSDSILINFKINNY